jgi:hypothetical protein
MGTCVKRIGTTRIIKDDRGIRDERGYAGAADATLWKDYLVELLPRSGH